MHILMADCIHVCMSMHMQLVCHVDLLQAVAVDGSGDNAGRVKGAAPQVSPHQVLRQGRDRPGALQVVSDREILKGMQ